MQKVFVLTGLAILLSGNSLFAGKSAKEKRAEYITRQQDIQKSELLRRLIQAKKDERPGSPKIEQRKSDLEKHEKRRRP